MKDTTEYQLFRECIETGESKVAPLMLYADMGACLIVRENDPGVFGAFQRALVDMLALTIVIRADLVGINPGAEEIAVWGGLEKSVEHYKEAVRRVKPKTKRKK